MRPGGLRLLSQQFSGAKIFLSLFNFAASLTMRGDSFCDMAKLTKRDIVVAISNQTGMVQHEVFDVVQRTLDKITDSLAIMWPSSCVTSVFFNRGLPSRAWGETQTSRAA